MSGTTPPTLESLPEALAAALEALPDLDLLTPPKNALSLLTVKNDLLLTYLHNLSFLTLLRLRNQPIQGHPILTDLIRTRLQIERGTKPLESRLKYQIDKAVAAVAAPAVTAPRATTPDSSDADSDADSHPPAAPLPAASAAELSFRPNPAALAAAATPAARAADKSDTPADGVYRPPRIAPVVMPSEKRERGERPVRSRALDEFVAEELAAAPVAEPSIGSNVAMQGRHVKTGRERREEQERREYEEANFVRLPKMTRKERAQQAKRGKGVREGMYGGEDWRSFAGDLDRLTKRAEGTGGARKLERARKRGGEEDGPRGEGLELGGHYEARVRALKKRRKD